MAKKEIQLTVLGKRFPVLVEGTTQEQRFRAAEQLVNERLAAYKARYAMGDEGYLLMMFALDMADEMLQLQESHEQDRDQLQQELLDLERTLSAALRPASASDEDDTAAADDPG